MRQRVALRLRNFWRGVMLWPSEVVAGALIGFLVIVGERDGAIGRKRCDEDDAEDGDSATENRFRREQALIGGLGKQADVSRERLGLSVLPQ